MNILLSAFSCAPNTGSEAGAGWNWALSLSKMGHNVWVFTGAESKSRIEQAISQGTSIPNNLHFVYLDLTPLGLWGKNMHRWTRTHNYLWQLLLPLKAYRIHKEVRFDLAHHLTWGVIRSPSLLGLLRIPFVFGPAGGAEYSPWRFTQGMSVSGKAKEIARHIANKLIWVDPFMWLTFATADRIYTRTSDSKGAIPSIFRKKTHVRQEMGIKPVPAKDLKRADDIEENSLSLLFAGRLIHVKGLHLGLRAIAEAQPKLKKLRLTVIGDGPEKSNLQIMARRLGIDSIVEWREPVPQRILFENYKNYDALLFPSLHDSGGNTVMEAITHGLPVICLDLGGPPQMVCDDCGFVVDVADVPVDEVVSQMSNSIVQLADNELWRKFHRACLRRGENWGWDKVSGKIYSEIEQDIDFHPGIHWKHY